MEPVIGKIKSAYQYYHLDVGRVASDETLNREQTMPVFTNYKTPFYGTLDHIFYNTDCFDVVKLLETPQLETIAREKTLPSTQYPSDHVRIEAILQLK